MKGNNEPKCAAETQNGNRCLHSAHALMFIGEYQIPLCGIHHNQFKGLSEKEILERMTDSSLEKANEEKQNISVLLTNSEIDVTLQILELFQAGVYERENVPCSFLKNEVEKVRRKLHDALQSSDKELDSLLIYGDFFIHNVVHSTKSGIEVTFNESTEEVTFGDQSFDLSEIKEIKDILENNLGLEL